MKVGQVIGWKEARRRAWTRTEKVLFVVLSIVNLVLAAAIAIERGGCQ